MFLLFIWERHDYTTWKLQVNKSFLIKSLHRRCYFCNTYSQNIEQLTETWSFFFFLYIPSLLHCFCFMVNIWKSLLRHACQRIKWKNTFFSFFWHWYLMLNFQLKSQTYNRFWKITQSSHYDGLQKLVSLYVDLVICLHKPA